MNNNEDEIREITAQLQGLQIEQTALIARLAREQATLIDRLARATGDQSNRQVPQANRVPFTGDIRIGDLVSIRNPRFLQENIGTVTKLTATRVTVTTPNGTKILRAYKNIIRN